MAAANARPRWAGVPPPLLAVLPNGAVRPRLVAAPYLVAEMTRACETLRRMLPRGFDRTIRIGNDRQYRVTVGAGWSITIKAIHRPGTEVLLAPGGDVWFAGKRLTPSTDAPTRRQVAERINVVGRLAEALRRKKAIPSPDAPGSPPTEAAVRPQAAIRSQAPVLTQPAVDLQPSVDPESPAC